MQRQVKAGWCHNETSHGQIRASAGTTESVGPVGVVAVVELGVGAYLVEGPVMQHSGSRGTIRSVPSLPRGDFDPGAVAGGNAASA